ncbi:MAG: helix-turn-helix domain-containing protein [Burkholderiales bacterium]|nr:helix-turn-helix domain-containing protein [Burkholderiales bacterium]
MHAAAAKKAVEEAFRIVGSASAVARAFGISAAATLKWLELSPKTGLPKIPPERCRRLEELTGGKVTREQMRPDVFGSAEIGA